MASDARITCKGCAFRHVRPRARLATAPFRAGQRGSAT
ncbi:hypothetical protein C4K10_4172 [Pseudomonas chlororaphis subsp. aureofaciens]|nr:hypothetical protein C4K14_4570 [Pseudomonas chlororaphis subsp. aureofaciens]AZD93834.1 hypothetical protein C4K13_4425 [Pseudomonas chlororaphis subsp. aureofaciens]AZE00141.1 hypothetical protein C4K12_4282 [Pseudomonas chlororaphis subsp. aureofaciens]AZE06238.1 hypothetical protein C4K11_4084 [Pseudomonas chlororaphis subsp. aureofaciens]AZE12444.1 hypothetical protein C4K10_4172 [Pseudomonas chlororaphis subsp. aureofaciens]